MHITLDSIPQPDLWQGALQKPALTLRGIADSLPARIGQPFQWAQGQLLGEKWQPPQGWGGFYLLQLAFTLNPRSGQRVSQADFSLYLSPQGQKRPVAFDAFPKEQLAERPLPVKLGLGPDFKLGDAEASLASAETTLDFGHAIPVVRVDGLQEAHLRWRYTAHAKHPLTGSRRMLAVIALPQGVSRALAALELIVSAETHLGPLRLSPPEQEQDRLRFSIGEKA
jgi:hypothetical protein